MTTSLGSVWKVGRCKGMAHPGKFCERLTARRDELLELVDAALMPTGESDADCIEAGAGDELRQKAFQQQSQQGQSARDGGLAHPEQVSDLLDRVLPPAPAPPTDTAQHALPSSGQRLRATQSGVHPGHYLGQLPPNSSSILCRI